MLCKGLVMKVKKNKRIIILIIGITVSTLFFGCSKTETPEETTSGVSSDVSVTTQPIQEESASELESLPSSNQNETINPEDDKLEVIPDKLGELEGYYNEEYGFSLDFPEYWIGKTYVANATDELPTGAVAEICFYNQHLYDLGETSSASLLQLEIYNEETFPQELREESVGIEILGEKDDIVVVAVLRTGMGIIEDEKGSEQLKKMDDLIPNLLKSFRFE